MTNKVTVLPGIPGLPGIVGAMPLTPGGGTGCGGIWPRTGYGAVIQISCKYYKKHNY